MKILKCALLFLICLCSFNFSNGQNCQYLVGYWPLDTISYNDNINNGSISLEIILKNTNYGTNNI